MTPLPNPRVTLPAAKRSRPPARPDPREALPPGDPVSWQAIAAGTQFAGTPYPWSLREFDLRERPRRNGTEVPAERNKS